VASLLYRKVLDEVEVTNSSCLKRGKKALGS
jgi:hypothetical protein